MLQSHHTAEFIIRVPVLVPVADAAAVLRYKVVSGEETEMMRSWFFFTESVPCRAECCKFHAIKRQIKRSRGSERMQPDLQLVPFSPESLQVDFASYR